MNIDDEIAELTRMRDYANQRLRELRSFKPRKQKMDKQLWVQTNCISPHIIAAVNNGDTPQAIANRAGVDYKTVTRIRDNEAEWTREETSDKIMMALGLPHIHLETVVLKNRVPEPPPTKFYED